MAPKNANSKKEQGRAKKAENEDKKKAAAAADKVECFVWSRSRPIHRREVLMIIGHLHLGAKGY